MSDRTPTRDEIAEELSGWPIGTGYYQTQVGIDEAREMADAVLELLKGHDRGFHLGWRHVALDAPAEA